MADTISGLAQVAGAGQSPCICHEFSTQQLRTGCNPRACGTAPPTSQRFRAHGSPHRTCPLGTDPAGQPDRRAGKTNSFSKTSRLYRITHEKSRYTAWLKPRFWSKSENKFRGRMQCLHPAVLLAAPEGQISEGPVPRGVAQIKRSANSPRRVWSACVSGRA